MDPKISAIVSHTNKHTTSTHQAHNGAGGELPLAPFMGVAGGDGDSWPECRGGGIKQSTA